MIYSNSIVQQAWDFAKWMGQPHLYAPDMPQIFFVAFDLLAIASIGIAL